jgi:hypothetical protein
LLVLYAFCWNIEFKDVNTYFYQFWSIIIKFFGIFKQKIALNSLYLAGLYLRLIKQDIFGSWPADPKSLYTVAMVDPDAESRLNPKLREFRHWLVINVPGSDVKKGKVVSEYWVGFFEFQKFNILPKI